MTEREREIFELGRRVERATIKLRLLEGSQARTELNQDGEFFLRYRGRTYGPFGTAEDLIQAIDENIELEEQREDEIRLDFGE